MGGNGMEKYSTRNHKIWALRLVAGAALLCMAAPGWGATAKSGAAKKKTPAVKCAAAKKIYSANCVMCHMADGRGNPGLKTPNFTNPKWQKEHTDAELISAVSNGVKGTPMPAWKGSFNEEQIEALIKCVVRGFGKKSAPAHHTPAK